MEIIVGDRIGKLATLAVVCSAIIFDRTMGKVLLTRRSDNGRWCLPGGHMDPGESAAEACAREVKEETGLDVRIGRLIGVYSTPHRITKYADGNRYQAVVLSFEAYPVGGELHISDETTDYGYFDETEMQAIDLMETSRERIVDAFAGAGTVLIR